MPWRGPEVPGEFPTLGYAVAALIEDQCAIPDGERAGEPYILTDEMYRFLLHFYRVDEKTGQRFVHYRGGQLVRPQKWGKGPFSAAIICAEAHPDAQVVPDGFDADGEPVGRPWPTPWIQVTAVSEDQTANIWRALIPMIELGRIADVIADTGDTRVNLGSGGIIEPVTFSAKSRLGQRITFAPQDETHSWTTQNGGRAMADNQRRNLAGTGGRWLETTNAWDPAEESVAQQTSEKREVGVCFDDVDPGPGSIRNARDRRRMIKKVYGDSLRTGPKSQGWVDVFRIEGEIDALVDRDPAQAERYFLNRKRASEDSAFDLDRWKELSQPAHEVPKDALVVVGVDGARFADALAVVATEVETGHQWPLGIWERPEAADDDYEHPFSEVDGVLVDAWKRWYLWRVYIDPQWIDHLVDAWQGRWGTDRIVPWYTNRPRQVAWAIRNLSSAIASGDVSNDGDEDHARHVGNAKRWKTNVKDDEGRPMHLIGKDRASSPRKMDAAMASVLSWEARGDAIAAGAKAQNRSRALRFS